MSSLSENPCYHIVLYLAYPSWPWSVFPGVEPASYKLWSTEATINLGSLVSPGLCQIQNMQKRQFSYGCVLMKSIMKWDNGIFMRNITALCSFFFFAQFSDGARQSVKDSILYTELEE